MNDKSEGWTKEEYLAHIRRPASERSRESNLEKGLFYSVLFCPEALFFGGIALILGIISKAFS